MIKYVNTGVVFSEIPDETTLSINISNCPCHCPGCHSSYLWNDEGIELTTSELDNLICRHHGEITCVSFMGGDADPMTVASLAAHIKQNHKNLKVAWYSGRTTLPHKLNHTLFNYIKVGPYLAHLGALDSRTTNQRFYQVEPDGQMTDITYRFWKH